MSTYEYNSTHKHTTLVFIDILNRIFLVFARAAYNTYLINVVRVVQCACLIHVILRVECM